VFWGFHTRACARTHTHMRAHTHIHAHARARTHMSTYACIQPRAHTHTHALQTDPQTHTYTHTRRHMGLRKSFDLANMPTAGTVRRCALNLGCRAAQDNLAEQLPGLPEPRLQGSRRASKSPSHPPPRPVSVTTTGIAHPWQ
jgi:hypothetical protein